MNGATEPIPEFRSRLTRKGQVTIPKPIRHLLGVVAHDAVAFVVEGDSIHIKRVQSTRVGTTAGVLARYLRAAPESAETLREAAERAVAAEAVHRSGGG